MKLLDLPNPKAYAHVQTLLFAAAMCASMWGFASIYPLSVALMAGLTFGAAVTTGYIVVIAWTVHAATEAAMLAIDYLGAPTVFAEAPVARKEFSPGDGDSGDFWRLHIRLGEGPPKSVDVSQHEHDSASLGTMLPIRYRVGRFSGRTALLASQAY